MHSRSLLSCLWVSFWVALGYEGDWGLCEKINRGRTDVLGEGEAAASKRRTGAASSLLGCDLVSSFR